MTNLVASDPETTRSTIDSFDSIAPIYDRIFTESAIGRAQRLQVSRQIKRCFSKGSHILEINCGTGEDALAMARRGVTVSAFDASQKMVQVANQKLGKDDSLRSRLQFQVLSNEDLSELEGTFDGALSDFAGLNCSMEWPFVLSELTRLVKPGGHILLCVLSRLCLWEIAHYLLRGEFQKAFRRIGRGARTAKVDGGSVSVIYPSINEIVQCVSGGCKLVDYRGVGVFVPPSYCESQFQKRKRALGLLGSLDLALAGLPCVRAWGDHVLLDFVRRDP